MPTAIRKKGHIPSHPMVALRVIIKKTRRLRKMQRLPVVEHKGKRYFIDYRLKEFRPVNPPIEFIPFDSKLGREIDEMPAPEER